MVAVIVCIVFIVNVLFPHSSLRPYLYKDEFITVFRPEDPTSATRNLSDVRNLLDLLDFRYILEPDPCPTRDSPYLGILDGDCLIWFQLIITKSPAQFQLAILLITSYAGHDEVRSAHRKAMPARHLDDLNMRRVFLLADIPPAERFMTQAALRNEHARFGDLLQGNFREAYRNLTYKHTMGLRWASTNRNDRACHRFIVKADDDTVFDVLKLYEYLSDNLETDAADSRAYLAGFVLDGQRPIRNVANKWYVSREEFADDLYPDYLSGWLYLTNPATAGRLVERAQLLGHHLWIDDTWLTGVVRAPLQVPLVRLNAWFSANAEFLDCCVRDMRKYRLRCDYFVGPNGGDAQLIVDFTAAVQRCYAEVEDEVVGCAERKPDEAMAVSCVARRKVLLEEHGRPVVEPMRL